MIEQEHPGAKIYGIVSLKGGVGKTTTVANVGASLVKDFGKKVLAIDANFYAPNLGIHFGLIDPSITLYDVLVENTPITQAIYAHDCGLHIIPSSLSFEKIDTSKLQKKLEEVIDKYDIILLDTSPNLGSELRASINASNEIIIISSLDYPTISTTLKAIALAKELRTKVYGIVINRVRGKRYELSIESVKDAVHNSIIGFVPEDEKVPESVYEKTPVVLYAPNCSASKSFKKLAARMVGVKYKTGFMDRFRAFFGFRRRGNRERELEARIGMLESELNSLEKSKR